METQIFHHPKLSPSKKSSKRNRNPSRYYNSITSLKVSTQAKISSFKNPHIKTDLGTQRPKSHMLLYSRMNLNTISLPSRQGKARPTKHPTKGEEMKQRERTQLQVRRAKPKVSHQGASKQIIFQKQHVTLSPHHVILSPYAHQVKTRLHLPFQVEGDNPRFFFLWGKRQWF